MSEERIERTPNPEPEREPFDPHTPPLDDEDDAQYLSESDPRRVEIEAKRGRRFGRRLRERFGGDD